MHYRIQSNKCSVYIMQIPCFLSLFENILIQYTFMYMSVRLKSSMTNHLFLLRHIIKNKNILWGFIQPDIIHTIFHTLLSGYFYFICNAKCPQTFLSI